MANKRTDTQISQISDEPKLFETSWSLMKRYIEGKGRCNHVASQICSANGVKLPCCSGTSSRCKQDFADFAMRIIKQQCDEKDELRGTPTKKAQKQNIIDELRRPTNVTNVTNITVTNNFYVQTNIIGVKNQDVIDVVKTGLLAKASRYEIYDQILALMQENTKHPNAKRVLSLLGTREPADKTHAEIELHNALVDSLQHVKEQDVDQFLLEDAKRVTENCQKTGVELE